MPVGRFSPGVSGKLQSYVYLLVDPGPAGPSTWVGAGGPLFPPRPRRQGRRPTGSPVTPSRRIKPGIPVLERIREVESDRP